MIWPLDEKRFFSPNTMTVQTHHVKLVRTDMKLQGYAPFEIFQMQANSGSFQKEPPSSQGPHSHKAPSVDFTYDVSPLTSIVKEEHNSVALFLTNLCAVIGGVFTVL